MKRYLISCTTMAAALLVLATPLKAQDKESEKVKLSDNEEIIIKKKGDKDTRLTIEIKGDSVLVNGKPLIEFDDDNIVIKKGRTTIYGLGAHSPFRGQTGTLSIGDDHITFLNNNPFLGVVTAKGKGGVRIDQVTPNSGAEKAGLKAGDVITKIDDEVMAHPEDVTKTLRKHKADDKINITYDRDGKSNKTEATLGKRQGKFTTTIGPKTFDYDFDYNFKNNDFVPQYRLITTGKPRLGIKAQDTEEGKGVKVLAVDDESAAEKAGVQKEDIILEFDDRKVNSADELSAAAREAKDKAVVKVLVSRKGKNQTLEIKTPKKLRTANL